MRFLSLILWPNPTFVLAVALLLVVLNGESLADPNSPSTVKPQVQQNGPQKQPPVQKKTTIAQLKSELDQSDFIAALKALHIALMEVDDGSTFVWHKTDRRLKGAVRPTSAFRDPEGRVCRHLEFSLALGGYIKGIESIACRDARGAWVLEG